jgi:large subunit ribosomal protein L5
MTRLQEHYVKNVVPKLQEEFNFKSAMEVPRITMISINMGLGEATGNKKIIESAVADIEALTGQKPVVTLARKSVAAFKIRDGWPIGAKVNLRRTRMYEFLDRLISVAIPRIRDFRGLNVRSFDGRGNYTFGLKEQIVFPEIEFDKVDALRGMDVTITTTAKTNAQAEALLRAFNFPLRTK